MILHESFGPLGCGVLVLVGLGCGMEPGQSTGSTEGTASATNTASADESTTVGFDTVGDECQWGRTDHYVVLVGASEGTVEWSTAIKDEILNTAIPAVPDLEGGIIFSSWGDGTQLVRHGADGSRIATLTLEANLKSLAADGNGRLVYGGVFDVGDPGYVELDQLLTPLGPRRSLPWPLTSILHWELEIATGPNGTTVAAGGDNQGEGRFISQLDADGNELWTSPWPIASQPDDNGIARVAAVAALDDGTVGLALTGWDLWLEAFDASGQHLWAQTVPNRGPMDMIAAADTFVVTSEVGVDAFTADGSQAWSVEAGPRNRARPCPDGTFVMARNTGYVSFDPGGNPVEHDLDLFSVLPLTEQPIDGAEGGIHDALCTTDGVVIVLAELLVEYPSQGDCATGG